MADDTNSNEAETTPSPSVDVLPVRALTSGEIARVETLFGGAVDHAPITVIEDDDIFAVGNRMAEFEGDIFVPSSQYHEDFSAPDVPIIDLATFMHEVEHVRQEQSGLDIGAEQQRILDETGGEYDNGYKFRLESGKIFEDYNIEQQAEIVRYHVGLTEGVFTPDQTEELLPYIDGLLPFADEGGAGPGDRSPETIIEVDESSPTSADAGAPAEEPIAGPPANPGQQPPQNAGVQAPSPPTVEAPSLPDAGRGDDAGPGPSRDGGPQEPGPTLGDLSGDDAPQGGDNTQNFGALPPGAPTSDEALDDLQDLFENGGAPKKDDDDGGEDDGEDDDSGQQEAGAGDNERLNPEADDGTSSGGGTLRSPLNGDPNLARPVQNDFGGFGEGRELVGRGGGQPDPGVIRPADFDTDGVELNLSPDGRGSGSEGAPSLIDSNVVQPSPDDGGFELDLGAGGRGFSGGRPSVIGPDPNLAIDLGSFDFEDSSGPDLLADSPFNDNAFEADLGFDNFDTLV